MKCRRKKLEKVGKHLVLPINGGLWLDKYLTDQTLKGEEGEEPKKETDAAKNAKTELIRQIAHSPIPEGYPEAIELRSKLYEDAPETLTGVAKAKGRIAIGLGERTPLEVGLRLEHTWGVPILPGTALKGLAAATAHKLMKDDAWRKPDDNGALGGESFLTLFGTTDNSGAVRFLDAWWRPDDNEKHLPIDPDVMTVHHPDYYQAAPTGTVPPPSDRDSPNPISFATTKGAYLIAVEGPDAWCDAAMTLLEHGLKTLGVGAKTNAGYGRMALEWKSTAQRRAEQEAQEAERRAQKEAKERAERRNRELLALDQKPRWTRLIDEADSPQAYDWLKSTLELHKKEAASDGTATIDDPAGLSTEERVVLLGLLSHKTTNKHISDWASPRRKNHVEEARKIAKVHGATPTTSSPADDLATKVKKSKACDEAHLRELFTEVLEDNKGWSRRVNDWCKSGSPAELSSASATEIAEIARQLLKSHKRSEKSKKKAIKKLIKTLNRQP